MQLRAFGIAANLRLTARARAGEILVCTSLDNRDVDVRQRQLACQCQSGRTSSDNHHRMVGHRHTPVASAATIDSAARDQHLDNDTLISSPRRHRLRSSFLRDHRALEASPLRATY